MRQAEPNAAPPAAAGRAGVDEDFQVPGGKKKYYN